MNQTESLEGEREKEREDERGSAPLCWLEEKVEREREREVKFFFIFLFLFLFSLFQSRFCFCFFCVPSLLYSARAEERQRTPLPPLALQP